MEDLGIGLHRSHIEAAVEAEEINLVLALVARFEASREKAWTASLSQAHTCPQVCGNNT